MVEIVHPLEEKEFIYSQRTWLVPEDSHVTDTCSYIFCHYGIDANGFSRNFIKIAGCDDIITYNFSQTAIVKTIKFIDCLLSVINGRRKESKITIGNGWVTYSIKKYIYVTDTTQIWLFTKLTIREKDLGKA